MTNTPQSSNVYRFVVKPRLPGDARSLGYLHDAHALGMHKIQSLDCHDLYFIEGEFEQAELERLANELLSDPITQTTEWGRIIDAHDEATSTEDDAWLVEVALRPGVTDPVAVQIIRAAGVLGLHGMQQASTGLRFVVRGNKLQDTDLHRLARRLLANPTIHRYALGELEAAFPHSPRATGQVEWLPVRELDDPGLLVLSKERRAALDLAEMRAIQAYYRSEGREPSDIELETIAQTWSEHCVHKTFKACIEVTDASRPGSVIEIDGLLRTFVRAATEMINAAWVRSAFTDNAGIIDFDEQFEVSFKVETHNHPSAIEPFGGANTGVGGVIRDVLGVSAKPIAATDVLCFGPQDFPVDELPDGVLHPRRIQSGVVAGVQDYGNKIGIPTVNGAVLYDPAYTANPLVFCGCVGIAPKNSHPRTPRSGDRVIVLGGGTGRDGLRGATFSSMTMDAQTGEVSGASVQIGDPITEKGLIEVLVRARDQKLYHAVTDCGAGGLSSAVGEMSSGCGADVELQHVRLKYPGLAPWEIWLSEAQERMVLAVPEKSLPALQDLCTVFDVDLMDIGAFNDSQRLVVRYAGKLMLDLANEFLHNGIPQRHLTARVETTPANPQQDQEDDPGEANNGAMANLLLFLLSTPDIASKAPIIRIYDHEVQGATVVKPLTGVENDGPSDGCVLRPLGTTGKRGIVLSNGINPQYGKRDAYRMALSVVDEAIRNAVAVGADPQRIALLDNFCWGDPLRPETLGSLVQAAQGCYEAAVHYGTPFISGKDSLNNEYLGSDGQRHAIPPTLLISAIGIIENVRLAVTMDLKAAGDEVYLLGEFKPQDRSVPGLSQRAPRVYRALHAAMQAGQVRACHDLSEGGLAAAAAEMCIAGRLGLDIQIPQFANKLALFGETNGCLLVEVSPDDCPAFEALLTDLPYQRLGVVTQEPSLSISQSDGQTMINLPVTTLLEAWSTQP
jgi:phosphoribosylformylglycinamidine synthase